MGRKKAGEGIAYEEAQRMLDDGSTVLEIALRFAVSPQSVYDAIKRGRLRRPAVASA